MSKIAIGLSYALLAVAQTLHAQYNKPIGIWRATVDGVPSAVLTVGNDSGEIGGTLVLYGIDRNTKAVAGMEIHTLVHPKFDSNTLTFQVRRPNTTMMTFNVAFTTATKAQLHCVSCGVDAPVVDLAEDEALPGVAPIDQK
ncbi:MAG TPA: hypothetical protein VK670_14455 [Silvibacterium sp.]|nr:hypothetical protein [Silvibacterium sp.]